MDEEIRGHSFCGPRIRKESLMTSNDIGRQFKLIDASKKIAAIYALYGQMQAAQNELNGLGRALQAKSAVRRTV